MLPNLPSPKYLKCLWCHGKVEAVAEGALEALVKSARSKEATWLRKLDFIIRVLLSVAI